MRRRSGRRTWLLVLLAVALPYVPALGGDFLQDDYGALSYLTEGGALSWPRVFSFFFPRHLTRDEFLRPLPVLSAALDFTWFGPDPFAFHLTNLLLHVATAAAVGLVAARMTGRPEAGPAAALLYGLYPGHAESVAWVAHRMVGLCVFLTALALLFQLRDRMLAAGVTTLAALLAKEPALVLPALIFAWELLGARRPAGAALLRTLPALWAVVAYGLWKVACFGRLITGYGAYPTYFAYFWGEGVYRELPGSLLRFLLPLNEAVWPGAVRLLQAAALVAALGAVSFGGGRPGRVGWLGLLWSLGSLALVFPLLAVTPALTNSRHFTPAVPGLALLGAALWRGGRAGRWALLAFLVYAAPLPLHVDVYRQAGVLARRVRAQVWRWAQHYPPETTVVVARTPSLFRGAPVFGDGSSLRAALAPPFVPRPLHVIPTLADPPGDPDSVLYTLSGLRAALLVEASGRVRQVAGPCLSWWYPAPLGIYLRRPPWEDRVPLWRDPPFLFRSLQPWPYFRLVFRRGPRFYPLLLRVGEEVEDLGGGRYRYRLSRGALGRPEALQKRPEARRAGVVHWWVEGVADPTRPRSAAVRSPVWRFVAEPY